MGRLAGVELPIVSLEHHYVVTEPVEVVRERDSELPVLRDPEGSFYAARRARRCSSARSKRTRRRGRVDGVPDGFHGRLLPAGSIRSRTC